jgi:hypothetical protein
MNKPGRALPLVASVGLLAVVLCAAGAVAAPPSAELARCAAIRAASERLACYDALVCAGITAADERLACYDALPQTKSSPPQTAPAEPTRPETGSHDPSSFGLAPQPTPAAAQGPQKIKARVAGVSAGRQGNVTVILDNGQTWAVYEPDPVLQLGDAVTIRHAALGSYLLTTARRHSYRVQRLQ